MTGGYIRTNWRQSKSSVDANAIGQGWQLGSGQSGPGCQFPNGGFIVGSFAGSSESFAYGHGASVSNYFAVEAISAMNMFYGSDGGGKPLVGGTSGFKIVPFNVRMVGSQAGSNASMVIGRANAFASITDSVMMFFITGSLSEQTSVDAQAHIVWEGFIVSSP